VEDQGVPRKYRDLKFRCLVVVSDSCHLAYQLPSVLYSAPHPMILSSILSATANIMRSVPSLLTQVRTAVCQPGQYGSRKERMRRMGDTLNPSLWKWYHRHGYWATRRKNLTFMKKKSWRYHEVVGLGKADPAYVARFASEPSRYRPFKNYCRF
jgi:hypothetical protein